MIKMLSIAALVSATATASFAGSLYTAPDAVVEQEEVAVLPVAGSGIGIPVVIGGVLAAAAVAALINSNNDSDATTTTTVTP